MIPSLIIIAALLVTGLVLYIHHRMTGGDEKQPETAPEVAAEPVEEPAAESPSFCCGQHLICEKPRAYDPAADYYDDEELDAYAGRGSDMYSEAETECFREVLDTLAEGEALEWSHALQRRGINLPDGLRDELLLLISESRAPKAV